MKGIPILTQFKFNKLKYKLLQRNDSIILYGIGEEDDEIPCRYEVSKIIIENIDSSMIESIPSNDYRQIKEYMLRCFNSYKAALRYFNWLTECIEKEAQVSTKEPEDIKDNKMAA